MQIRPIVGGVTDVIPVKNVLVSVGDKRGLDNLARGLCEACPNVRFLSTGGTYTALKSVVPESQVQSVEEYTGFPEMEGGLVKTLHPKIHAGILGERNNPAHQEYLRNMDGEFIDLVIVNLYPFRAVAGKPDAQFEEARGNIDIGGPTMIRAAAKNFPSCGVVADPLDYVPLVNKLRDNKGSTTLEDRFRLAVTAFGLIAQYDEAIAHYLAAEISSNGPKIMKGYVGEGQ